MNQTIQDVLGKLELGAAQQPPGFVVLPILAPSQAAPVYLPLGKAIEAGDFAVSEVSEGGTVSKLLVVNGGALPVLLLDGQELLGAKQNRIINVTTLVPAHAKLDLPVSCTERGRWRHVSRTFAESDVVAAPSVRRTMNRSVMTSARSAGEFSSDQMGVWQSVDSLLERGDTLSGTGAMSEAFAAHRESVASAGESVPLSDGQVGMVVLRGGQVVGLEYVGRRAGWFGGQGPDGWQDSLEHPRCAALC